MRSRPPRQLAFMENIFLLSRIKLIRLQLRKEVDGEQPRPRPARPETGKVAGVGVSPGFRQAWQLVRAASSR